MTRWSFFNRQTRRGTRQKDAARDKPWRKPLSLERLEDRTVPSTLWTQRGGDAGHSGYVDATVSASAISLAWNQNITYTSSGYWDQNGNRGVAVDDTRIYRTELDGYWASGNYHIMAFD